MNTGNQNNSCGNHKQSTDWYTNCKKNLHDMTKILTQIDFLRKNCQNRTFMYKVYDTTDVPQILELTIGDSFQNKFKNANTSNC